MKPEDLDYLLKYRIMYKDWKPIIEEKGDNGRLICYEFYPFGCINPVRTKWQYISLKWEEDKIIKRIFKLIEDAETYELHHNFKLDGSLVLAHEIPFSHLAKLAPKNRGDVDLDF